MCLPGEGVGDLPVKQWGTQVLRCRRTREVPGTNLLTLYSTKEYGH